MAGTSPGVSIGIEDLRIPDDKTSILKEQDGQSLVFQVAVDATTLEMQWVCPKILWERLGVSP